MSGTQNRRIREWSILIVAATFAACSREVPQEQETASTTAPPSVETTPGITDSWLGRWMGPEGTYLEIATGDGAYQITIKDLDAARTFAGSAAGDHIVFQRDGIDEELRATNGEATGMKWLTEKQDCLTVKPGEGYCRD